jgi:beta-N-acetylhexosaminidase
MKRIPTRCFIVFFGVFCMLIPYVTGAQTSGVSIKNVNGQFSLGDFYAIDGELDIVVDSIMKALTDEEKISQMVVTYCNPEGNPSDVVLNLIENKSTGGVIFFEKSNNEILNLTRIFNEKAKNALSMLLPIYAIDGEPSFVRSRLGAEQVVGSASQIETEAEAQRVAGLIADKLKELGIHVNYAPVCDISLNKDIIGSRSFGSDVEKVTRLSIAFIESTQHAGVVATAKHFPGHGSVRGDTHKELIFIEGDPPELAIFRDVIESGVISIMVGHIAIRNHSLYDTNGFPSTLSRDIVTGLLKRDLGFNGIVVTDAMRMNAVRSFPKPAMEATRAGCDMILMPRDESRYIQMVLGEIRRDEDLRKQVMDSVRKIVRLKVCLGLVNEDVLHNEYTFPHKVKM